MASDLLSYTLNTDPTQLHTHTLTLTRRNAYSLSAVQIGNICTETQVDTHTHSPSASLSFGTSLFNDTQKKTKTYKEAEATPDERLYCSNMGRCRGVTLE